MFIVGMFIRAAAIYYAAKFVVFLFVSMAERIMVIDAFIYWFMLPDIFGGICE